MKRMRTSSPRSRSVLANSMPLMPAIWMSKSSKSKGPRPSCRDESKASVEG